jgi:DNA-binding CsgD family transcriptional regulator
MHSLNEENKFLYSYCESTHDNFKKICDPIFSFGIDYFCYTKIMRDGRFITLFNNLNFLQDWLFQPGGFGDVVITCYEQPEPKSYILSPYDELTLQKDRTFSLLKRYQIANSFNIFKRHQGEIVGYHFYSKNNSPIFPGFYINNIPLLEHFISYFEEKAKDMIDVTDESKLGNFYQKLNIPINFPESEFTDHKIKQFLSKTQTPQKIIKKNREELRITKREGQCLYHLSSGNTFKEIGKILNLSPRTVEFYINNLKEKSGYKSKEELIVGYNYSPLKLLLGTERF